MLHSNVTAVAAEWTIISRDWVSLSRLDFICCSITFRQHNRWQQKELDEGAANNWAFIWEYKISCRYLCRASASQWPAERDQFIKIIEKITRIQSKRKQQQQNKLNTTSRFYSLLLYCIVCLCACHIYVCLYIETIQKINSPENEMKAKKRKEKKENNNHNHNIHSNIYMNIEQATNKSTFIANKM